MRLNFLFKARLAVMIVAIFILAGLAPPQGFAQSVASAGLSGRVVDSNGYAIADVVITLAHAGTGRAYNATTNASGRFNLRGLPPGGPYSLQANVVGYQSYFVNNIFLELSRTAELDVALSDDASEVFLLDALNVQASKQFQYTASAAGSGSVVVGGDLEQTPSVNRSFADIARLDPRVSIADGSFGAGQLVAAGQNNRSNNIQIDGVKINDQFGLESDGNPSLANPISLDTIDEVSIELSPYDVRQSGFIGASVNAVTKSGSNTFRGSVYRYFENEDLRGKNPVTGLDDRFEETTLGLTYGGPILRDKLFFFVAYEELERKVLGPTPGFIPDPAAVEQVRQKMINDYGFDPGTFGSEGDSILSDEKVVAKIDWNINARHRASVRYNLTEGEQPNFTEFADFSSSQPETNLTSHWFRDLRKNESYVFQLFSDWSDNFSSELRLGRSDFDSSPTNPNVFPEIIIDDFPGLTRSGAPTTRGELFFGRDDSRHSNQLSTDVENLYLGFDWKLESNVVTFGFDRETSTFFNLFLQETFAEIEFQGLDGFLNDEIDFFDRALGIQGTPIEAFSDFTVTGLFVQDVWSVTDRLRFNFGLRYDKVTADNSQPLNPGRDGQSFEQIFGVRNTNTVDGASLFAPRFSFDYAFGPDENPIKLAGGMGLFNGRNPWVWISNTFSNNGVNSVDISVPPSGFNRADGGGLRGYLQNDFDRENPVSFVDPSNLSSDARSQVDVLEPGFRLPSILKYNLKAERALAAGSDWSWWAEALLSQADTQLYTKNLNLRSVGVSPDGRTLFNGRPDQGRGADPRYSNVYQLSNSSKGDSVNYTIGLKKRHSDRWSLDASYTYGSANDVSNQGSSTASSNFAGNPIFNQNDDELAASAYEVRHRFLVRGAYDFEFRDKWTTRVSLVYEGKSGQNYSLLFDNDYNGDGAAFDNDLFWIPNGPNDPIIDQAGSTGLDAMFEFLDSIGANNPGLARRNAYRTSFRHRLDLNIVQDIPMGEKLKTQFFLNVLNFGNLLFDGHGIIDEVPFQTLAVANGRANPDGTITYDFDGATPTSVRAGTYSNLSRWRAQLGLKLNF